MTWKGEIQIFEDINAMRISSCDRVENCSKSRHRSCVIPSSVRLMFEGIARRSRVD